MLIAAGDALCITFLLLLFHFKRDLLYRQKRPIVIAAEDVKETYYYC